MSDWFELTGETLDENGHTLHRIRYTIPIKRDTISGKLRIVSELDDESVTNDWTEAVEGYIGGYVEFPDKIVSPSFISGNSKIIGDVVISNSYISDSVVIGYNTTISDSTIHKSSIFGRINIVNLSDIVNTKIFGDVSIEQSEICNADISGSVDITNSTIGDSVSRYNVGNIAIKQQYMRSDRSGYSERLKVKLCKISNGATIMTNVIAHSIGEHNAYVVSTIYGGGYEHHNILTVGPLGSRADKTTFYMDKEGQIYVKTGCFDNTIKMFEEAVNNKYATDSVCYKSYLMACELAKVALKPFMKKDDNN